MKRKKKDGREGEGEEEEKERRKAQYQVMRLRSVKEVVISLAVLCSNQARKVNQSLQIVDSFRDKVHKTTRTFDFCANLLFLSFFVFVFLSFSLLPFLFLFSILFQQQRNQVVITDTGICLHRPDHRVEGPCSQWIKDEAFKRTP